MEASAAWEGKSSMPWRITALQQQMQRASDTSDREKGSEGPDRAGKTWPLQPSQQADSQRKCSSRRELRIKVRDCLQLRLDIGGDV